MSGWPQRLSRLFFGPDRKDEFQPPDDVGWVRDLFFNALFWQVPGLNVVSPKAGALVVSDALAAHEEVWNPNGDVAAPTFSHVATGHYRLTYDGTYKDNDDNDVAPGLTRAKCSIQGTTPLIWSATVTSGVQVDVYIVSADGNETATDAGVWIEVF